MSVETDCFDLVVDFDLHPLLTLPIVQDRKWIKKVLLSEPQASFNTFPFFVLHNWEAEGQWQRGRLSLLPFLWRSKEREWLSGHPRPTNVKHSYTSMRKKYRSKTIYDKRINRCWASLRSATTYVTKAELTASS